MTVSDDGETTSPEFRFELVDPLSQHKKEYRKLHNLLFPTTAMSFEWLEWYHGKIGSLRSGVVATRTYGVFDQDVLAGIWSVEPGEFITRTGKVIAIGRAFALGIHPDYRRKGLFVSLSKFAIEQERRLAEFEYIVSFPQAGRPVIAGHLKAGWEIVQNIDAFSFAPETLETFTPRSHVKWLSDFEDCRVSDDVPGSFKESPAYRNLRWLMHPENQYICLTCQQSYVVLKPYAGICHILDFQGGSAGISTLLEASKSLARRHRWREINIWCGETETYRQHIVDAGFKRGSGFSPAVVLVAVRIRAAAPLSLTTGSHIQMGADETY